MSANALRVGSEIKYLCPKCQLELAHTILAMIGREPVRIRCNTCKSERNYRAPKPFQPKSERRIVTARAPVTDESMYHKLLKAHATRPEKKYNIGETFELNDLVIHPTFGRGIVIRTIFPDRVEVLFQEQSRVLMGKVAAPTA
jgi:hypothetical protein